MDFTVLSVVRPGESAPAMQGARQVSLTMDGPTSAPRMYNRAMKEEPRPDYWVLTHPDVEFPHDFHINLKHGLNKLRHKDPLFGPVGVIGIRIDAGVKNWYGSVWDRTKTIGRPVEFPVEVHSLDEVCVVLRADRDWWLNDLDLMTYHLWATELCYREAESIPPKKAYVLPGLYLRHNSKTERLIADPEFFFNAGAIAALHRKPRGVLGSTSHTVFDMGDDQGLQITR